VGTGQRGRDYVQLIKKTPGAELTALCDTSAERLQSLARQFDCTVPCMTTSVAEMAGSAAVDAVVVTVPDRWHREVAETCFAAGKHVMLEKPMALTAEDCRAIIRAQRASGRMLQMGFVMRCSPFYRMVRRVLDSGELGQVMSISATEYLAVNHSASYMRRWHRRRENSGSFMLAKCSHDIDMLSWFAGAYPARVASFGDNNFFLPSKQPATHCSKCPKAGECPYRFEGEFVFMSEDEAREPSRKSFDLCVYNADKNIVDNQVSIFEYANGVRALFSLQLFRPQGTRQITVTGSRGYLWGDASDNAAQLWHSSGNAPQRIAAESAGESGHGGADGRFVQEFVDAVRTGKPPVADLRAGLASTVVGIALERAREEKRVVEIDPAEYAV